MNKPCESNNYIQEMRFKKIMWKTYLKIEITISFKVYREEVINKILYNILTTKIDFTKNLMKM